MKIEAALTVILKYGKYKGKILDSIPSSYLKWASENFDNDIVATAADVVWHWREAQDCHF